MDNMSNTKTTRVQATKSMNKEYGSKFGTQREPKKMTTV